MAARQSMDIEEPNRGPKPAQQPNWQMLAVGGGVAAIAIIGVIVLASGGSKGCDYGEVGGAPPMQGNVPERTIWTYNDAEGCEKEGCQMSDFLTLCMESIERNKGDFDFNLVHKDEVFKYLSKTDLPHGWEGLNAKNQKDSVVNALLGRYGGVALDLKTIMFKTTLNDWWDEEMTPSNKPNRIFKGFRQEETAETATWFMMARREGLFRTAMSVQAFKTGNEPDGCTKEEQEKNMCYGSSMANLVLCRHLGGKYCECFDDEKNGCGLTAWKEVEAVDSEELYAIDDPREKGPQSPFKPATEELGAEAWGPLDSTAKDNPAGFESFQQFKIRFEKGLPFVTLQKPGEHEKKSKSELLSDPDTFIYQWLCEADEPDTDENACA